MGQTLETQLGLLPLPQALYLLLVTNKASNILEDLETLRLLAKVVPEYIDSLDEEVRGALCCRAAGRHERRPAPAAAHCWARCPAA